LEWAGEAGSPNGKEDADARGVVRGIAGCNGVGGLQLFSRRFGG
jgi:hypothetical protein